MGGPPELGELVCWEKWKEHLGEDVPDVAAGLQPS